MPLSNLYSQKIVQKVVAILQNGDGMHCSAKYSIAILYIWHSLKIDWVYRFHMSLNTPNISHSTFF